METLTGRGALVTGGSRGIGRAIVRRLAGPDSGWISGQVPPADGGLLP